MRWFTLVCVALTACSGTGESDDTGRKKKNQQDDTGGTGNTDDTSTYEPPPPWTPTTGNYVLTSSVEQSNNCGELPGQKGTPTIPTFGVSVASDASGFTLSGDDPFDTATATTSVNCPLVQTLEPEISYAFDCETAHSEYPWDIYGFEGVFTIDVDVIGNWTTATHWTGTFTSVANCHGPDCDVAIEYLDLTIPCTIVADGVVDIGT